MLQSLGDCHGFLLGNGTESSHHQLIAHAEGIDSVFLEDNSYTDPLERSGILQTLRDISCESGNGFCDDQVNAFHITQLDHPLELWPLISTGSCDSFVSEHIDKFPFASLLDCFGVVFHLCRIGVELIGRVGRDTAVGTCPELSTGGKLGIWIDSGYHCHGSTTPFYIRSLTILHVLLEV